MLAKKGLKQYLESTQKTFLIFHSIRKLLSFQTRMKTLFIIIIIIIIIIIWLVFVADITRALIG